jgi:hypothetical protein
VLIARRVTRQNGLRGKIQMMFRTEAKAKIAGELANGAAARQGGLEGRARVCARRAAGAAIREYLDLRGLRAPGSSAYDLLAYLQELAGVPGGIPAEISQGVRQAAEKLLARVDEDYSLPGDVDLLAEAAWLAETLETGLEQAD